MPHFGAIAASQKYRHQRNAARQQASQNQGTRGSMTPAEQKNIKEQKNTFFVWLRNQFD